MCVKLKENIRDKLQYLFLTQKNNKRYLVSPIEQNLDSSILSI